MGFNVKSGLITCLVFHTLFCKFVTFCFKGQSQCQNQLPILFVITNASIIAYLLITAIFYHCYSFDYFYSYLYITFHAPSCGGYLPVWISCWGQLPDPLLSFLYQLSQHSCLQIHGDYGSHECEEFFPEDTDIQNFKLLLSFISV